MTLNKKRIFVLIAALVLSVFGASASFAWDSQSEVRRLNREAPALDGFKGAAALVWLQNNAFRMLSDGTMEHTLYSVVMMGELIPDSWREMKIPVPENGSVVIEDAAWYNPMTGFKEGSLAVGDEKLPGGASLKVVKTPAAAAGRAVVLVMKRTFPRRYGADGAVMMAGSLPRWEQMLTVEIPDGMTLYRSEREVKKPVVTKANGTQTYKWTVMNQEAWNGEGFIEDKRPLVLFSFKKGLLQSLNAVNEYASVPKGLAVPSFVKGMDSAKAGQRIIEWMEKPERKLQGYPKDWIRQQDNIPPQGPWTQWERTLILNKWLNDLGWKSSVWWKSDADLNADAPSTLNVWDSPVLEILSSGKSVFYQSGQRSEFGALSPETIGVSVYRAGDGRFETKTLSSGSPSDNKFSLLWHLALSSSGAADGTLSIMATGGWTELISRGFTPTREQLGELLNNKINFAIPGMSLVPVKITTTRTGYKMDFKVHCAPAIVHGGSMLLRLPGGIPSAVGEMIDKQSAYTLRFPFIIEQKVRMKTPAGYKLLQTPPLTNFGEGSKAVLKESIIHWPKKGELLADSMWVVKTQEVDLALAGIMRSELAACLRWPVLDLPFRK